jgi:hypothetical protein
VAGGASRTVRVVAVSVMFASCLKDAGPLGPAGGAAF